MNAPAMADEPRLYSRQERVPVEVIAPQHLQIHSELERWGAWNRERYQQGECSSVESEYEGGGGGREVKPAMVSLPPNPQLAQLDRVVRYMRMNVMQHGEAIKMYYAGAIPRSRGNAKRKRHGIDRLNYVRCSPQEICIVLHLRFEEFSGFMFYGRAMVINLLRRQGT